MATEATKQLEGAANGAPGPRIEAIERALIGGDLAQLTEAQRLAYYNARCQAAGLDPRSQPFAYIELDDGPNRKKLTLYALKAATDQLISNHKLTVKILRRGFDTNLPGVYVAECEVAFPRGQVVHDIGAVWIGDDMMGAKLCNAVMRAVTKAKRRTVLSACGLGMPDETEVDPNAEPDMPLTQDRVIIERPPGPAIVHEPSNEPRSETISEPKAWLRRTLLNVNDVVRNHFVIENRLQDYKHVANEFQVIQGLITKWIESGHLDEADILKPNGKRDPVKVGAAFQVAWHQDAEEVKSQIRAYLVDKTKKVFQASGMDMPEEMDLVSGGDDESQATADED